MAHAHTYFNESVNTLKLDSNSFVVEVASNDGYLLRHFVEAGIPSLGIEPTASTAAAARLVGVPTLERFFGLELATEIASQHGYADLIVGNNVFAHVPNPLDFLAGIAALLKPGGVATLEFPHLINLVQQNQFDTIYHEHFAYLSLTATVSMAEKCNLEIFRVEDLATHGGSLRVHLQNKSSQRRSLDSSVLDLLNREQSLGIQGTSFYSRLQEAALIAKNSLVSFLLEAAAAGKQVCGYGAAAKGNTLLNYAGVRPDLIPFVADLNPAKQGKFMPGSRIPIVSVEHLLAEKPDYILILPWNIKDEILDQLSMCRTWGARFVTAIPETVVLP